LHAVKASDVPIGRARGGRALRREEKAQLALLALPTFGLALAITIASSYIGEIARQYTQEVLLIGVIIGSEGVMALWVPLVAGAKSDQLNSRLGRRLPFVIGGGIPAALALGVLGFFHSLVGVAVLAAVFFACYFVAYEPYRAMYPDLFEADEVAGRAQSAQAVARGCATGCALLGGGLLLSIARQLPFLVAAVVLVGTLGAFTWLVIRRGLAGEHGSRHAPPRRHEAEGVGSILRRLPEIIREHPALRAYLFANALWEMALSGLKAFVVLYLTLGLGYSLQSASLIIGAVAVVILIGAAGAGKVGDRLGRQRVAVIASIVYGIGFLVPALTTFKPALIAAIPFIALGGGAVMTLAYALLMPLMPEDEHGLLTGFYSLSRGLGIIAGPILAGLAVDLSAHGPFERTQGFQAIWLVCAAGALGSVPLLRALRRSRHDREQLKAQ
jgi:MFS family permease